jgi:hypothetical protein
MLVYFNFLEKFEVPELDNDDGELFTIETVPHIGETVFVERTDQHNNVLELVGGKVIDVIHIVNSRKYSNKIIVYIRKIYMKKYDVEY